MRSRGQAALVQLAVFLGGGVLGPVWHLAHHRNDHSHGAEGQPVALDLGAAEEPGHGRSHHTHPHPHPHRHPAPPPSATRPAPPETPAGAPSATPVPRPLDHGHGSLAHLGLALLGAPAILPVPAPEPGEWVAATARAAPLTLFHPSFPLPRPPPSSPAA